MIIYDTLFILVLWIDDINKPVKAYAVADDAVEARQQMLLPRVQESNHLLNCFRDDLEEEGSYDAEEVEYVENVVEQFRLQMVVLEEKERDAHLVKEVQLLHLD